ncbi:hypothetical protein MHAS_03861 [Mycolicibacterium hassiacum DSM 44199]|nr:hypothetical protein MHAS_03861 [Mycolicibacterium hassiacum DSM 44199]
MASAGKAVKSATGIVAEGPFGSASAGHSGGARVPGILALVGDRALCADIERIAAAAGLAVVRVVEPSSRQAWLGAAAVVVDRAAAERCARRAWPRRGRVILVGATEPDADDFRAALAVGAQHVMQLPAQDTALMSVLADVADAVYPATGRGPVVAVVGGHGGAGASVFAAALASAAAEQGDALLVEADPWSGGIDLVVGLEAEGGVRWRDLQLRSGRLAATALREALPRSRRLAVLSADRGGGDIDAAPLAAVLDAGSRGGSTVVCDVPRRATAAAETTLGSADLVVVVTTAQVRSAAATEAVARWVSAHNPNAGLVVRGPAPGGMSPAEVAEIVGLPLLAAMRPQPRLAVVLEHGGLRLRRRAPLAVAAGAVLALLQAHPGRALP